MEKTEENQVIDLGAIFKTLIERRKVFYWVLPITIVVSAALILCVPRFYQCTVILAPETQNQMAGGTLGSLASSFGFDLGSMGTDDALYPTLYPSVVSSPDFLIGLFDTEVATADGSFTGTYYQYMLRHQKRPWWIKMINKVKAWLSFGESKRLGGRPGTPTPEKVDPFWLNKMQSGVISLMQKQIVCMVDKKTDVITLRITDQDKLVVATIGEAVRLHLQDFITDYRTSKAKLDIEYYTELEQQAKEEYEKACRQYDNYMDSHSAVTLERYKSQAQNLKNEVDLRFSAYQTIQKQNLAAHTKIQENTPIYTIIQGASVPELPAGPRRLMFVVFMCFMATIITALIVARKHFHVTI